MRRKISYFAALFLAAVLMTGGCSDISEAAETAVMPETSPFTQTTTTPDTEPPVSSYTEPADTAAAAPPGHVPDTEAFHARLEEICEANGVYGMGVAVFADGEVIHTDSVGYADIDTKRPVTDDTIFRAASVSKLVSTMLVMRLCDEGMYDFDGDLSEQSKLAYEVYGTGEVKLWHLLTHTAGLTDTYTYDKLSPSMKYSTDYLLKKAHIGTAAGEFFNYTNFGAGTIGSVIERITGMFFHDYAERVMFEPLKMDAGYVIDKIRDRENCAVIYDHDGEVFNVPEWGRTSEYYESFGLGNSYLAAQCELLIKAGDLALIGTALAGDGTVNGVRVLSEESIERMHEVYLETDEFGVGLNVRIYEGNIVEGRTLCGHPGNALGAITGLFYDRTDRTGVAILTNRSYYYMDGTSGLYSTDSDVVRAVYSEFF